MSKISSIERAVFILKTTTSRRLVMHVVRNGEGKGSEGKGVFKEYIRLDRSLDPPARPPI